MDKEAELTNAEQEHMTDAARDEQKRGSAVGVSVLLKDGAILTRGYTYAAWAFRWANREIEQGFGVAGYISGRDLKCWRFSRDEGWEAF